MANTYEFTDSMFCALNHLMLDMMVAIFRKKYVTSQARSAHGMQKSKEVGKYHGHKEDIKRKTLIQKHLGALKSP